MISEYYLAILPKPNLGQAATHQEMPPTGFTIEDPPGSGTYKKAVGTTMIVGCGVIPQYAVPLLGAGKAPTGGGGGAGPAYTAW